MIYLIKCLLCIVIVNVSLIYCGKYYNWTEHANWKYLPKNCGINKMSMYSDRIIGGIDASLGEYPWLVRLGFQPPKYKDRFPVQYLCAGAVITNRYVLSAAHCFDQPLISIDGNRETVELANMRFGDYNTDTGVDCDEGVCAAPHQDIKAEQIIIHKRFRAALYRNDIALIKTQTPIEFNGWIEPICLPKFVLPEYTLENTSVVVAGWGSVLRKGGFKASAVVKTVNIDVQPGIKCQNVYRTIIVESVICAGGVIGRDSCKGDSGGPAIQLLTTNGKPKYYIFGIVSFGPVDCGSITPGIYTRVTYYMKWILDHITPK